MKSQNGETMPRPKEAPRVKSRGMGAKSRIQILLVNGRRSLGSGRVQVEKEANLEQIKEDPRRLSENSAGITFNRPLGRAV